MEQAAIYAYPVNDGGDDGLDSGGAGTSISVVSSTYISGASGHASAGHASALHAHAGSIHMYSTYIEYISRVGAAEVHGGIIQDFPTLSSRT